MFLKATWGWKAEKLQVLSSDSQALTANCRKEFTSCFAWTEQASNNFIARNAASSYTPQEKKINKPKTKQNMPQMLLLLSRLRQPKRLIIFFCPSCEPTQQAKRCCWWRGVQSSCMVSKGVETMFKTATGAVWLCFCSQMTSSRPSFPTNLAPSLRWNSISGT